MNMDPKHWKKNPSEDLLALLEELDGLLPVLLPVLPPLPLCLRLAGKVAPVKHLPANQI